MSCKGGCYTFFVIFTLYSTCVCSVFVWVCAHACMSLVCLCVRVSLVCVCLVCVRIFFVCVVSVRVSSVCLRVLCVCVFVWSSLSLISGSGRRGIVFGLQVSCPEFWHSRLRMPMGKLRLSIWRVGWSHRSHQPDIGFRIPLPGEVVIGETVAINYQVRRALKDELRESVSWVNNWSNY